MAIDTVAVFSRTFEAGLPNGSTSFEQAMALLDESARQAHGNLSVGALANAHGTWFEWLLAIAAWNARFSYNKRGVAALLPNVNRFDCAQLYVPVLSGMINHLKTEVAQHGVSLITSNPDFVLLEAVARAELPELLPRRIDFADR